MKRDRVPQDQARAFMGLSKVLYAEDEQGHYVPEPCNGWEAEEIVLDQAIAEFEHQAAGAWQRARDGKGSALEYHMYRERMDLVLLAQSAAIARWRVRRHLRPGAFVRLSSKLKSRYAEALGSTPEVLQQLPEAP